MDDIVKGALGFRDEIDSDNVSKNTYNARVKYAKKIDDKVKFLSLQLGRHMSEVGYEG
jgi:hypothetical protein